MHHACLSCLGEHGSCQENTSIRDTQTKKQMGDKLYVLVAAGS